MNAHDRRQVADAAAKLHGLGEHDMARKLLDLAAKKHKMRKASHGGRTLAEDRAGRKASRGERWARICREVDARAGDACEACWGRFTAGDPGEHDHLIRGSGNRTKYESVATVWKIHRSCHRARTHERPIFRRSWPVLEAAHLARWGIRAHPELARRWANYEAKAATKESSDGR